MSHNSVTQSYKLWLHADQELRDAQRKLAGLPCTASDADVQACAAAVARLGNHAAALWAISRWASLDYRSPDTDAP